MAEIREGSEQSPSVVAAFDIGSNSIKMTVARSDGQEGIEEFLWRSATVRLGSGIEATGRLADDRIEAALDALKGFADEARSAGAGRLIGVATEATRVASNGEDFLRRVSDDVGLEIKTITGDEEAELTFRGISATLDLSGDIVVADIGGGSSEVIFAPGGLFSWGRSIPLGSGRLTDRLVTSDPPTSRQLDDCESEARRELAEIELPVGPIDRLVVVGGTGEYLQQLVPEGLKLTTSVLDGILTRLTTISAAELTMIIDIPEARARVLPAGVAIVHALAQATKPRIIEGAKSGIRTGMLLAAFSGEI